MQNVSKTYLFANESHSARESIGLGMALNAHNHVSTNVQISHNLNVNTAVTVTTVATIPQPTAAVLERWNARSEPYRRLSPSYQAVMRRFISLAEWPHTRCNIFTAVAEAAKPPWKFSTRASYWIALHTAMEIAGVQPTPTDHRNMKWLESKAKQELPDQAPPLLVRHVERLAYDLILHFSDEAIILILVTWILGQRISDMILIDWRWIRVLTTTYGQQFLIITLIEGKVINRIGAYSLSLDLNSPIAQAILTLAHKKWTEFHGSRRLLTQHKDSRISFRLFDERTMNNVRIILHEVGGPEMQLRSVRRGGLQHMALLGYPLCTIITFSKHVTEHMLMTYLDKGAVVLNQTATQSAVTSTMTSTFPWLTISD